MSLLAPQEIYATVEATWPPAGVSRVGPWTIRDGKGGGKRVSSATACGPVTGADIEMAAHAMEALDQPALFMIRAGDDTLDAMLDARGYHVIDPVVAYASAVETLTAVTPPRLAAFPIWPPLAIQHELWAEGGIGPGRLAVMQRADGPKTTILARQNDRAAGTAFVAIHGDIAMLHALEVAPDQRRQGVAVNIMRVAAHWAQDKGARVISVVVTRENSPANRLYAFLNMSDVGHYHYRTK